MITLAVVHPVPKGNGIALIGLGVLVLLSSLALSFLATRPGPTRSDPSRPSRPKWAWGYGVGGVGLLLVIAGVFVLATGK